MKRKPVSAMPDGRGIKELLGAGGAQGALLDVAERVLGVEDVGVGGIHRHRAAVFPRDLGPGVGPPTSEP